jgi:hypothetical protein
VTEREQALERELASVKAQCVEAIRARDEAMDSYRPLCVGWGSIRILMQEGIRRFDSERVTLVAADGLYKPHMLRELHVLAKENLDRDGPAGKMAKAVLDVLGEGLAP